MGRHSNQRRPNQNRLRAVEADYAQERERAEAAEARVKELEADAARFRRSVVSLEGEVSKREARVRELEKALRVLLDARQQAHEALSSVQNPEGR